MTFRRLIETALWPFAAALGIDIGAATFVVLGGTAAFVTAIVTASVAVAFWYAFAWFHLASHTSQSGEPMEQKAEPTPLDEKIKEILTECRIVLPGTQAFLGFQMIVFLTEAFTKLPRSEQLLLLGALELVALSAILLMTPPAYHRIAEKGNMTQRFLRLASKLLLCAMIPLALGICVDFYVVLSKVTHAPGLAFGIAIAAFLTFNGILVCVPIVEPQRRRAIRDRPSCSDD